VGSSWLAALPDDWELAGRRPHGALEAIKRPSPTTLHVIVGKTWSELCWRVRAADARQREKSKLEESA
jgi:hypothetical protein